MKWLLNFLHKIFDSPRCDYQVCENPKHYRVHYGKRRGQPSAWVPWDIVVGSRMERLGIPWKYKSKCKRD